jgi:hypothetical protein
MICIRGDHNRVQDAGGHGKIMLPDLRHDDSPTRHQPDGQARHREGGRGP